MNKHQPAGAFHAPEWVGYPFFSRNDYPYPLCVHGKQVYKRGSYCKAVKTAWSPRHPFRPYGKMHTAHFIGALAEKCDFGRRVIRIYSIRHCGDNTVKKYFCYFGAVKW